MSCMRDMMLKLKDMLKQSSSVSLTTDAAKMPTGLSYSAITGHWISSGWELLSAVLAVSISNISHTAQEIGSLIMELGIKYTLDDRLDAIATDNGANFVAAMEDLLENGICEEHPKNASASTNATSELIAVFRKLVNKIHGCSLLTENLRSAQSGGPIINLLVEDEQDDGEHQVNEGASDAAPKDASFHSSPRGHTLKLIKVVITKWNSTYYMLAPCVLLDVPLRKLVEELGLEGPADNNWSTAQLLCDFMKPFQVVTDYLQGETYPTLGSLSRKISQLMLYLSRPKPPQSWGLGKTCADLPKAVSFKEEYDVQLRLHENRAVESTTHLDPNGMVENATTHNSLLLQYLHEVPRYSSFICPFRTCIFKSQADPEKKKASVRDSYKTDPEKKKASVRDSYKADPEKKKASVRDSYKADPEKKKASVRDSYKADPEKKAPQQQSLPSPPPAAELPSPPPAAELPSLPPAAELTSPPPAAELPSPPPAAAGSSSSSAAPTAHQQQSCPHRPPPAAAAAVAPLQYWHQCPTTTSPAHGSHGLTRLPRTLMKVKWLQHSPIHFIA
eukprot:Em0365g2a